MTKEEIDILWNKALRESIDDGSLYTRYRFAELVAEATIKDALDYKMGYADGVADEREAILQISCAQWFKTQADFEEAIRARGETK